MNRDQLWGRLGEANARAKGLLGALLRNRTMILQARIEYAAARAQRAFGDVKSAVFDRRAMNGRRRIGYGR
jgi:hypothetical protein